MDIKVSYLINHVTRRGHASGWSEQWYTTADSFEAAVARVNFLGTLRLATLPNAATLVGIRLVDVAHPGISRLIPRGTAGSIIGTIPATDTPWQTLLNRCRSSSLNNRSFYMRCIPDEFIVGGDYAGGAPMDAALTALQVQLAGGNWKFRGKDLSQVAINVGSISAAGVVAMTAGLPGLNATSTVELYRVVNDVGESVTGRYELAAFTDTANFTLWNYSGGAAHQGKIRRYVVVNPTITEVQEQRIVRRKVGRPFFLSRGRVTRA